MTGTGAGPLLQPEDLQALRSAAGASSPGHVWVRDRAWAGGGCGITAAAWLLAAEPDIGVGIWVTPGADNPVRLAEDLSLVSVMFPGRVLVGGDLAGVDPAWARRFALAWRGEPLDPPAHGDTRITPRPAVPGPWWSPTAPPAAAGDLEVTPCVLGADPARIVGAGSW